MMFTLFMVCIKDHQEKKLVNAMSEYSDLANAFTIICEAYFRPVWKIIQRLYNDSALFDGACRMECPDSVRRARCLFDITTLSGNISAAGFPDLIFSCFYIRVKQILMYNETCFLLR